MKQQQITTAVITEFMEDIKDKVISQGENLNKAFENTDGSLSLSIGVKISSDGPEIVSDWTIQFVAEKIKINGASRTNEDQMALPLDVQ